MNKPRCFGFSKFFAYQNHPINQNLLGWFSFAVIYDLYFKFI